MIKFEDFVNTIDSDRVDFLVICNDKPYNDYLKVVDARSDKCVYKDRYIDHFDISLVILNDNKIEVNIVVRLKDL